MISKVCFEAEYTRLAASFTWLRDEGFRAVAADFLRPIMSDALWSATVTHAILHETQAPSLAALIATADELSVKVLHCSGLSWQEACSRRVLPSEVGERRVFDRRATDENHRAVTAILKAGQADGGPVSLSIAIDQAEARMLR